MLHQLNTTITEKVTFLGYLIFPLVPLPSGSSCGALELKPTALYITGLF